MSTLFRRPSDVSGADDDSVSVAKPQNKIYDQQMSAILHKYSSKDNINLSKLLNKYTTDDITNSTNIYVAPSWLDEREQVDDETPYSPSNAREEAEEEAPTVETVSSVLSKDNSESTIKSSTGSKNLFPKFKMRRSMVAVSSKAASAADNASLLEPTLSVDVVSSEAMNAEKLCLSLADSASHERSISGSHSMLSKEPAAVQPEMIGCTNLRSFINEVVDPKPDVVEAIAFKRNSSETSGTGSASSRKSFMDKFRLRSSASKQDAASVKSKGKQPVKVETVESVDDETSQNQSPSTTKSRFFGGKTFGKNKPAPSTQNDISSFNDKAVVPPVETQEVPAVVAVDEASRDQALQDTVPSCCSGTDKSALETLDELAETYLLPTPDTEVDVTISSEMSSIPVETTAPEETSREIQAPTSSFCMNKSTTISSLDAFADTFLLPTVESVIVPSSEDDVKRVTEIVLADETSGGLEMTTASSGFCLHKSATMDTLDALAETYLLPSPDFPVESTAPVVAPEVEKVEVQNSAKEAVTTAAAADPSVWNQLSSFDALDSFAERYLLPSPDTVETKAVSSPETDGATLPTEQKSIETTPVPATPNGLTSKNPSEALDALVVAPTSVGYTSPLDVLDSLAESCLLPTPDGVVESLTSVVERATAETKETKKKGWFWQ